MGGAGPGARVASRGPGDPAVQVSSISLPRTVRLDTVGWRLAKPANVSGGAGAGGDAVAGSWDRPSGVLEPEIGPAELVAEVEEDERWNGKSEWSPLGGDAGMWEWCCGWFGLAGVESGVVAEAGEPGSGWTLVVVGAKANPIGPLMAVECSCGELAVDSVRTVLLSFAERMLARRGALARARRSGPSPISAVWRSAVGHLGRPKSRRENLGPPFHPHNTHSSQPHPHLQPIINMDRGCVSHPLNPDPGFV